MGAITFNVDLNGEDCTYTQELFSLIYQSWDINRL